MLHKRSIMPFIIVFILMQLLALTVFAEQTRFRHTARYETDGDISLTKQFGHPSMTGAKKNQSIEGQGQMSKYEVSEIAPHIMRLEDEMSWRTAADAVRKMRVSSTIELCARPLSIAATDYVYETEYNILAGDIISPYHPLVVDGIIDAIPLTEQVWATRIEVEPGHEGLYEAGFIAAYGPGPHHEGIYDDQYRWWFDENERYGIGESGDRYVGNYFDIDQSVYTSAGSLKRFTAMSSPFSKAYLVEDLDITGTAEVTESFHLDNIEPGPDAIRLVWYELF